jgi:hypothetical protein
LPCAAAQQDGIVESPHLSNPDVDSPDTRKAIVETLEYQLTAIAEASTEHKNPVRTQA